MDLLYNTKIWSSAFDGCSCSLCAKLEGKAVKHNEPFVIAGRSVMEPPLHDGCRCTVIYENDPAPQLRRDYDTFISYATLANDSEIFNAAIKRAYDHEWKEAQSLKTDRGKKGRMDTLLQMILATQALSPANYEYLRELFG